MKLIIAAVSLLSQAAAVSVTENAKIDHLEKNVLCMKECLGDLSVFMVKGAFNSATPKQKKDFSKKVEKKCAPLCETAGFKEAIKKQQADIKDRRKIPALYSKHLMEARRVKLVLQQAEAKAEQAKLKAENLAALERAKRTHKKASTKSKKRKAQDALKNKEEAAQKAKEQQEELVLKKKESDDRHQAAVIKKREAKTNEIWQKRIAQSVEAGELPTKDTDMDISQVDDDLLKGKVLKETARHIEKPEEPERVVSKGRSLQRPEPSDQTIELRLKKDKTLIPTQAEKVRRARASRLSGKAGNRVRHET